MFVVKSLVRLSFGKFQNKKNNSAYLNQKTNISYASVNYGSEIIGSKFDLLRLE